MSQYKMNHLHKIKSIPQLQKQWSLVEQEGISGIRWLCRNDLFYLLVKICRRVDMIHPWVLDRCREVEQEPDGYLDLWAREHFKSSIITFGKTLQDILINPEITIGFFSENASLAGKFLAQIKQEVETNELLKEAFPDILYKNPEKESPTWNREGITFIRRGNPKEPTIEAQGLLSLKVGAHYDLMVFDDIITMNSVSTPEMVQKINDFFEVSLSQSKQGGRKRYIGTRYSFNDTYQMIIDRQIATPRIYPATADSDPNSPPVLFTEEYWIQKKRENSTYNLSCQYLQNPQAAGEKVFDTAMLQYYEIRPYKLNVAIVCDPANSMKKGSASTAMLVIGIGASNRKYLLDGFCHKMSLAERWENMRNLYRKWRADPGVNLIYVGYEKYGTGNVDLDYFREQFKKEPNTPRFTIKELTSAYNGQVRKRDRIERIQPDLNASNIWLPHSPRENREGNLTRSQKFARDENCSYRIAKAIRKVDECKKIYDLSEVFTKQLDVYPYGNFVDCIDGFSRIYDMDIAAPTSGKRSFFLPENELT
jgi:hypothetical protein